MLIVVNALSARRGGGITYLINLFEGIREVSDFEFVVLTSNRFKYSEKGNIKNHRVSRLTANPVFRGVWERIYLKRFLRRIGADILFCPGGLINVKPPNNCKTVTMFRNMIPLDPMQQKKYGFSLQRFRNQLLKIMMLRSMSRANLVIFISEYGRSLVQKKLNLKLNETVVIPHGLHKRFKTARISNMKRPEWLPRGEYILYVSILDVYKNQIEVVRGYYKVKQQRPTSEKLILVGEHFTRYGKRVKNEIQKLGLQDDILLPGSIPYQELPNVYRHAKLIIFASEAENCPNILLEALGAGKPLLVSCRQPMPEFGKDSVCYFDPAKPQDLACKIISIIDDQQVKNNLSNKARRLSKSYDWVKTAENTLKEFKRLLNTR